MKINTLIILTIFLIGTSCIEKKPLVGFMLPNIAVDRYKKEKKIFTERVKELGGQVLFAESQNDPFKQIEQARAMIDSGVKVIVISAVNINIAGEISRMAHSKKVKIIAYDRFILGTDLDFYITFKYEAVGHMMVDNIVKKAPKGKYVVFGGDRSDFNALEINKGQMAALKPHVDNGNIKIIYHVNIEEWSPETCAEETRKVFNLGKVVPDAIIASSDKLAMGVIDVLKEQKLEGKVLVTGMDADILGCKRILEGSQTLSVYKPFKQLALLAAETAVNVIKTGTFPETSETLDNGFKQVPVIFLEPITVTKENMKEVISNSGILSEKDIFN